MFLVTFSFMSLLITLKKEGVRKVKTFKETRCALKGSKNNISLKRL